MYALLIGLTGFADSGRASEVWAAIQFLVCPTYALGVFGFWLPVIACGIYATRAERPKWWASALIGTVTLILGVWLWILLGTLVGVGVD